MHIIQPDANGEDTCLFESFRWYLDWLYVGLDKDIEYRALRCRYLGKFQKWRRHRDDNTGAPGSLMEFLVEDLANFIYYIGMIEEIERFKSIMKSSFCSPGRV